MKAAYNGHKSVTMILIENGADLLLKDSVSIKPDIFGENTSISTIIYYTNCIILYVISLGWRYSS